METIKSLREKIIANHMDIINVMQWINEIENLVRREEQAEYPQIKKNTLQLVIDRLEEDLSNLEEEYHVRIEREDGSLTLPNHYMYEIDCYKKIIEDLKNFDIMAFEKANKIDKIDKIDNAEIVNKFEFSGGWADHMEQSTFEEALNQAQINILKLVITHIHMYLKDSATLSDVINLLKTELNELEG